MCFPSPWSGKTEEAPIFQRISTGGEVAGGETSTRKVCGTTAHLRMVVVTFERHSDMCGHWRSGGEAVR